MSQVHPAQPGPEPDKSRRPFRERSLSWIDHALTNNLVVSETKSHAEISRGFPEDAPFRKWADPEWQHRTRYITFDLPDFEPLGFFFEWATNVLVSIKLGFVLSFGFVLVGRWPMAGVAGASLADATLCNIGFAVSVFAVADVYAFCDPELATRSYYLYFAARVIGVYV